MLIAAAEYPTAVAFFLLWYEDLHIHWDYWYLFGQSFVPFLNLYRDFEKACDCNSYSIYPILKVLLL